MRERACSCPARGSNISEKHPYDQFTAARDADLLVKAVEVGVDGVGRDAQLVSDQRLVQPVKYASDDL
jgi:hypothetical protein